METIPFVRASVVLPFVQFLDQLGAPSELLLQQAHLPVSALNDTENLLPLYQCLAFVESAARSQGIANLGILVGQNTQLSQLGGFGAAVSRSPTLYDLLNKIFLLHKTLMTGEQTWLVEEGQNVWLHEQYIIPRSLQNEQAHGFSILVYLNIIRLSAEPNWQPDQMHVAIPKTKAFNEVDWLSNTTIYFNQPSNAICFPKAFLSKPLHLIPQHLPASPTEETLISTSPPHDFTASLQQLLRLLLPEGYPSLSVAAKAAGTSIRTFQRRLESYQLNYSQLVEQVRFERATCLLQDPSNQLIDIALDLGYTEAANFSRAFKRWTGVSPREFRTLHLQV